MVDGRACFFFMGFQFLSPVPTWYLPRNWFHPRRQKGEVEGMSGTSRAVKDCVKDQHDLCSCRLLAQRCAAKRFSTLCGILLALTATLRKKNRPYSEYYRHFVDIMLKRFDFYANLRSGKKEQDGLLCSGFNWACGANVKTQSSLNVREDCEMCQQREHSCSYTIIF